MGLAKKGGALLEKMPKKLSELPIDVDKAWLAFGITDLKELAAGMNKGDMAISDGTNLIIISPGSIGTNLIAHDWGNMLTFEYPP